MGSTTDAATWDNTQYRRTLRATLPHPPGINHSNRGGNPAWGKVREARSWQDAAILLLRAAGASTLPEGIYWLATHCVLHTARLDIDAPIKLTLDAISVALGVDDRWIGELRVTKVFVRPREEQRLELVVSIRHVRDREEWTACSVALDALSIRV